MQPVKNTTAARLTFKNINKAFKAAGHQEELYRSRRFLAFRLGVFEGHEHNEQAGQVFNVLKLSQYSLEEWLVVLARHKATFDIELQGRKITEEEFKALPSVYSLPRPDLVPGGRPKSELQKRVKSQQLTINYLESAVREAEDRVKRLKADRLYFCEVIIRLEDELAALEEKLDKAQHEKVSTA